MQTWQRQQGLSLIELLVAITIGLLLVSGVLQILTNSTESYRIQNAMMRLHENGQFAMEYLARDLRNTDFWGCTPSMDDITNNLDPAGPGYSTAYFNFQDGIDGTDNESGGGSILAGTDTITVRGSSNVGGGLPVRPPYGPITSSPITVATGNGIDQGEIILISDCKNGDIFQVTNSNADATGQLDHVAGSGSPGNLTGDLSKVYTGDAFTYRVTSRRYTIQTGANGLPALFMDTGNGAQELVEGVENMVVLYGEDTDSDGTANRYVRASSVGDMANVVSVRISLLIQSLEDFLTPSPQAYTFNGTTTTPGDNRLRRVYTTTIVFRNRAG